MEWKKSSEELPKEDGYYIVWSARPFIAWYHAEGKIWEFSNCLKVRAEGHAVTHWCKCDAPIRDKDEVIL